MSCEVYDVCIIGAGMFGSAAARHASANPAVKVCLVGPGEPVGESERARRVIHSSHYDEGRIVHSAYPNQAMQELSRCTIGRFREIEKLSGIRFYRPVGFIGTAERDSKYFNEMMEGLNSHGIKYLDLSHEGDLNMKFPFLKLDDRDYPIFEDYGAGYISPRKIVEAQKKIACQQGCHLLEDVVDEVTDLRNGVHEILTEGGLRVVAKRVIFCTGGFTPFKSFPALEGLKMKVNKETAALVQISKEESQRLSSMPTFLMWRDGLADMPPCAHGAYILPPIQYPNGDYYLKIGHMGCHRNCDVHSLDDIRKWYNSDGDKETIEKYSRFLIDMLPGLKVLGIRSKTCISCDSPSYLPYIDRVSPTVTAAVVGNGRGATVSDEVGRLAARLSLTGEWDSNLEPSLFRAQWEEGHSAEGIRAKL